MQRHAETRILPYTPEQIYGLVADVTLYPEFLPWVIGLRVIERKPDMLISDMIVGFKIFRETIRSKVLLTENQSIHIDYISGPLKYLRNDWTFTPDGNGGCKLDFLVEFEFKNRIFETMVGSLFSEAVRRMVSAFEARAKSLYSASTGVRDINNSSATRTA
jgi:coenzyme Q-binding protein COQ10